MATVKTSRNEEIQIENHDEANDDKHIDLKETEDEESKVNSEAKNVEERSQDRTKKAASEHNPYQAEDERRQRLMRIRRKINQGRKVNLVCFLSKSKVCSHFLN